MKRITIIAIVASSLVFTSRIFAQNNLRWRSFISRSGWSIDYPPNWTTASCQSCRDVHAPGIYVDFFPSSDAGAGGWVMVSPLAPKPKGEKVETWLSEVAATDNVNPQTRVQKLRVAGFSAIRVRYRTSDGGEMEEIYIAAGTRIFSISFSGDSRRGSIGTLPNYAIFNQMIGTFRVTQR